MDSNVNMKIFKSDEKFCEKCNNNKFFSAINEDNKIICSKCGNVSTYRELLTLVDVRKRKIKKILKKY
jgi:ribosomal protein S27AE